MTKVYIWDRSVRSGVGHASMQCRSAYVSWWPSVSLLGPSDLPRAEGVCRPVPCREFDDDRRDERRPPDHSIVISSLDEPRILEWWRGLTEGREAPKGWGNSVCAWTRFGWNSVRLVAAALEQGSRNDWRLGICLLFPNHEPVWTSCELRNCVDRLTILAGREFAN